MSKLKRSVVGIEPLELLLSPERKNAIFIVNQDSANRELFKSNLPQRAIKLISLKRQKQLAHDDDTSLKQLEVRDALKSSLNSDFFLSYFSSNSIEKTLSSQHLTMLGNTWKQQRRFEDKVFFFKILQKYHLPTPDGFIFRTQGSKVPEELRGQWVVQKPWTPYTDDVGPGTYRVSGQGDIIKVLKKLSGERELLFRRFVDGLTLGVTMLVGKSRLILSAPRFQVSNPFKGKDYLIGTQWLPTRALTSKQVELINETLQDLGTCLIHEGFHGLANIDLILTADQALILECNARSTTSSYLLANRPDLFHGRSYLAELFRTFRRGDPSFNAPYLPQSSFQGTSLELDPLVKVDELKGGRLSADSTPEGIYRFSEKTGRLIRVSKSLNDFSPKRRILLTSPAPVGVKFDPSWSLGTAITNFPLFSVSRAGQFRERFRVEVKHPKVIAAMGQILKSSWKDEGL